jgi:DNA replication licensing factor MCM2
LEALKDIKGPIDEYVSMPAPRERIKQEFHRFLTSYVNENGESVYGERIKAMCEGNYDTCLALANGESLEVVWQHLYESSAILAFLVSNAPQEILKIFDVVALEVVLSGFEEYAGIKNEIHVRIAGVPSTDTLRDLR